MKKLAAFLALLTASTAMFAQAVQVTATVQSSSGGQPYSSGNYQIILVDASGNPLSVSGYQSQFAGTLSAAGLISLSLFPNGQIQAGSKWKFQVCSAVPKTLNTPQPNPAASCFVLPVAITGAGDISTTLNAAAPAFYGCTEWSGTTWTACGSGITVPGGSSGALQWNNLGVFAGAVGGTTNGTHFAFGLGSLVDQAPTDLPVEVSSPKVIANLQETYTGVDLENGQYIGVTLNPSGAIPSTNAAYASGSFMYGQGANWNNNSVLTSSWTQTIYSGTGTGAAALGGGSALDAEFHNQGIGEVLEAAGNLGSTVNDGNGTIDQGYGLFGSVTQNGAGIITSADGVAGSFFSNGGGSTTTSFNTFHATTPVTNGDTVDTLVGFQIDEQCVTGVVTCHEINSTGTGPSDFAGPVNAANSALHGTITYTTATSDTATVTGAASGSHCSLGATNALAAAGTVGAYISSKTTNSVTVTHVATTASGGTADIVCTKD